MTSYLATLEKLQNQILLWIEQQEFVTWKEIQKNCRNLVLSLDEATKKIFGNYPEYRIFMPLYRNGCVEIARGSKNGYRFIWNWTRDKIPEAAYNYNSLAILQAFPAIKTVLHNLQPTEMVLKSGLNYYCNLLNDNQYLPGEVGKNGTGIYKNDNTPISPEYLYDKYTDTIYDIPDFNSDQPESLNICRTYVRLQKINSVNSFFIYNEDKEELKINDFSKFPTRNYSDDFPAVILRSLICFSPEHLKDAKSYDRITKEFTFKNVQKSAYKQLERIFSK